MASSFKHPLWPAPGHLHPWWPDQDLPEKPGGPYQPPHSLPWALATPTSHAHHGQQPQRQCLAPNLPDWVIRQGRPGQARMARHYSQAGGC